MKLPRTVGGGILLVAALALSCSPPHRSSRETSEPPPPVHEPSLPEGMVRSPVSQKVIPRDEAIAYVHEGQTYYFASQNELELFKQDPSAYLR